jgi:GT2 family glycosyltransferase
VRRHLQKYTDQVDGVAPLCQDDAVADFEPYTLVIVTYNHARTLPACLKAVAELEPAPAGVVVIDNDSTDGSADTAADFGEGPPIEVVRHDRNIGFAAAANYAIRTARTPWILLLNPDCAPAHDMIERLFSGLAACPDPTRVAVLTPRLVRAADDDLTPTGVLDAAGMVVTCSGRHLDRGSGTPDAGAGGAPEWVFGGTGAAALFRRHALDDVAYPEEEYFAETFFAYREDAELAWRLQHRGWGCLYVPDATASHRRGFRPEAGRRGHDDVNRYSVRNRFLLRAHCADFGWHLRCLPWWLVRDLMVVGACLTVERRSFPGLVDAWRLRGDALEKRRWVLGRRTVPGRQMALWFRKKGRAREVETP